MPDPLSPTVVIPTRDRYGMPRECLEALLGQETPASQIIVADDGSKDSTPEMLGEYGDRIDPVPGEGPGESRPGIALTAKAQGSPC